MSVCTHNNSHDLVLNLRGIYWIIMLIWINMLMYQFRENCNALFEKNKGLIFFSAIDL